MTTTRKLFENLEVFQEANEAASKRMMTMEEVYKRLSDKAHASNSGSAIKIQQTVSGKRKIAA